MRAALELALAVSLPMGACLAGSNLSNGVSVTLVP